MNWQQFLPLLIVMGVAVIIVWRSSSPKPHNPSCGCGCAHDHKDEEPKEQAPR